MLFRSCLLSLTCVLLAAGRPDATERKALALHHRLLTVDTHSDTPMRLDGKWNIGERHTPGKRG